MIPRISTCDNYIKDLQFQILHRYLPTNYMLYKMNKVTSMRCSFCETHIESITHLFYHCIVVRPIWNVVSNVLEKLERRNLKLRCQDVIFGFGFEQKLSKKNMLVNTVILYVKAFIWDRRKFGGDLNERALANWIERNILSDNTLIEFNETLQSTL